MAKKSKVVKEIGEVAETGNHTLALYNTYGGNWNHPHFKSIFSASNGCEIVIACPAPLCSDLGATTVVLPISDIASHKALMPLEKILSSLTIRIVGVDIMIKNQLNLMKKGV